MNNRHTLRALNIEKGATLTIDLQPSGPLDPAVLFKATAVSRLLAPGFLVEQACLCLTSGFRGREFPCTPHQCRTRWKMIWTISRVPHRYASIYFWLRGHHGRMRYRRRPPGPCPPPACAGHRVASTNGGAEAGAGHWGPVACQCLCPTLPALRFPFWCRASPHGGQTDTHSIEYYWLCLGRWQGGAGLAGRYTLALTAPATYYPASFALAS
jgi:hypothetical protein